MWGSSTNAKQTTAKLEFKEQVRVLPKDVDRYGRTVADVSLPSGHSLGQVLVANGLAWYYREYSNETLLGKLESSARAELGRGVLSGLLSSGPMLAHLTTAARMTCVQAAAGQSAHGQARFGL